MLKLTTLGPGADGYLEETVARGVEEYYLGVREAPGQWAGRSASRLGLVGEVDGDAFHRVLHHADPSSGERLTEGYSDPEVVGIDATFCAPKSASLLYALGDREASNEVRNAHDAAVRAALEFYENVAQGRRDHGGVRIVEGEGFITALYRHRTSRAAEPHLHTHAVIANLVYASEDQRWSALDGRPLFSWCRAVGHLYNAQLRYELTTRLGVGWQPPKNGLADIDGVSRRVVDAFSTRRKQILKELAATGRSGPRAAQAAAYATRTPKDLSIDGLELAGRWHALAEELGVNEQALRALTGRARADVPTPGSIEADELYRTMAAPTGLTAKRSTFDARHVIEFICNQLPNGAQVDQIVELAADFLASELVIAIDGPDQSVSLRRKDGRFVPSAAGLCRYTTPEMVETERQLLERAACRRRERTGIATGDSLTAAFQARPTLEDDQAEMVRTICKSGAGVDIVEGMAGAGKTFALAAAADAWTDSGYTVTGCSLAAKAARRLQDATGIESSSLDRLLLALDRDARRMTERDVIVVDEAAMVGTRKLHRLLGYADDAHAKVVLIGDPRQLPEIDAGGAFTALSRALGTTALTNNRRQVEPWERAALAELRAGQTDHVVNTYRTHGRLHEDGDTRGQLVSDWHAALVAGPDAVMLAARRTDVDDLNARARELLRLDGRIGDTDVLLGAQLFAIGDEVLALHNDYRLALLNGTRLTITHIDRENAELHARDEADEPVTVPIAYAEAGHLTHSYALTIHKAQGATVEQAFVLIDPSLTNEHAYTALSRASMRTDLYLDGVSPGDVEAHTPTREPDASDRLRASLQRSLRDELAIEQGTRERLPVEALRAEREHLAGKLGPRPHDPSARLAIVEDQIRKVRNWRDDAAARRQDAERSLERLGPVGRRLHRIEREKDAKRLTAATEDVDRLRNELSDLTGEHRRLVSERRTARQWEAVHKPDLDRLAELDRAIRLAETLDRSRAASRASDHGLSIDR